MLRPEIKPADGTPGVGTPSKPEQDAEETKPSYVPGGGRPGHPQPTPQLEPAAGPPAFDAGPSPNYTQEVTSYAQPPSSDEEARRREERKDRAKKRWEKARKQASAAPTPPETVEVADFDDLGWLDSEPLPLSDSPDWPGGVPLSQGQSLHVDHLLSIEDDTMVREMLIGIKRDGIPPRAFESDYLSQFAEWGWDDLSSARTLQVLETVRNSDWDDLLAQADRELIETTAQDLADNTIEGLIVIDAKTGETLLNRTGVLGAGGSQYVGLQDYEVEAFKGLELIFVHNHPNGSDASEADLRAAFAAGAEMLMVVTPQGYEYVYIRGANGMVRMRAAEASYKVGPGTAAEHVLLEARSWEQARRDRLDPPETMMLQKVQSQLESDIFVPEGMTRERAVELFKHFYGEDLESVGYSVLLSVWEDGWKESSGNWPERTVLEGLMNPGGVVEQAVQNWNHSASGMSDDEFAALLLAHLRQEGHYRRHYSRHPGDMFESFIDFWKNAWSSNSSVGPANLRIPVANELLGTAIDPPRIPMPEGFPKVSIGFDGGHKLDELVGEQWRNLDRLRRGRSGQRQNTLVAQEHLLKDDVIAIELAAANVFRGVERLFRQYLYDTRGLVTEEDIQNHLEEHGLRRDDLVETYLQQEEYRASMFNMLAWSSQGIAESDMLRTHDGSNARIAREHASGGVRTINAILAQGLFGLTMDADGVRLFNDDDVYAYRQA